jgi:predicted AAA+ superfamily ATPase
VPALHHYRQHSGTEVDLLIEHDGRLFPIEVKSSSVPAPRDARGMAVLRDRLGKRVQPGLLIYAGREVLKLGETDAAVPFDLSAVPAGAPEG